MHDIKEKPLTEKEFEVNRLIVAAGGHGDDQLIPFATMTYPTYLWSRWFARKQEAMCSVDHMHSVMEYAENCRVEVNLRTGEMSVLEQFGDSSYACEECLGRKQQFVIFDYNVGDFEHLQENESAGEKK